MNPADRGVALAAAASDCVVGGVHGHSAPATCRQQQRQQQENGAGSSTGNCFALESHFAAVRHSARQQLGPAPDGSASRLLPRLARPCPAGPGRACLDPLCPHPSPQPGTPLLPKSSIPSQPEGLPHLRPCRLPDAPPPQRDHLEIISRLVTHSNQRQPSSPAAGQQAVEQGGQDEPEKYRPLAAWQSERVGRGGKGVLRSEAQVQRQPEAHRGGHGMGQGRRLGQGKRRLHRAMSQCSMHQRQQQQTWQP